MKIGWRTLAASPQEDLNEKLLSFEDRIAAHGAGTLDAPEGEEYLSACSYSAAARRTCIVTRQ
jgi:hypothetical protein